MVAIREWHSQFLRQASWTKGIRLYWADYLTIIGDLRALDVGSGTGAVKFPDLGNVSFHGIDINWEFLHFSRRENTHIERKLVNGDANFLPYADNSYDLVYCHYFLLWISNPLEVVLEMKRVCKPGGFVFFLAEPDYGGRIDFPSELEGVGRLQISSLIKQGADPFIGRRLMNIAKNAGLTNIELGILGYESDEHNPNEEFWISEWKILREDLRHVSLEEEIVHWGEINLRAARVGNRLQYIPTFYLKSVVALDS